MGGRAGLLQLREQRSAAAPEVGGEADLRRPARHPCQQPRTSSAPGGDVATALYFGPFSGLPDVHRQLRQQIEAAGLKPGPAPREVYHTAPEDTDPDNHITELIWPLEA